MGRIVALVMAMLLWSLPVMAETYTWTDKDGTVNYTDDYYSVPKAYRKNVRKLGDVDAAPAPAEVVRARKPILRQPCRTHREPQRCNPTASCTAGKRP